jgi:imidazolonepropionase-like amidohydrolase
MKKRITFFLISCVTFLISYSQDYYLLKADKVFDGEQMHTDWVVLVHNNLIEYAGTQGQLAVPINTKIIDLKNCTLMPGMIEGHSHLFLQPYNETSWNDQVLTETRAERVARATVHAKKTLLAGFTTVRDLGTEGAEYDDVGLKQAIEKHIIPGPRMIVATRAIVTTGSYGPRNLSNDLNYIKGAAEADGTDNLIKEVRTQIGKGADVIKLYADYYWGPGHKAMPTFTVEELKLAVEVAKSSGRQVVAHATSAEGMRRAILAGVTTIEHGTEGTLELFRMMKEKGIAYCPTVSADEAIAMYRGWKKEIDPEPESVKAKRNTFKLAMESGVTILMGGDVGVFAHGDNAREMETMAAYGMKSLDVLKAATSVNADVFNMANKIGRLKKGLFADIIAVEGDPSQNISQVRKIKLVMKDGVIYLQE